MGRARGLIECGKISSSELARKVNATSNPDARIWEWLRGVKEPRGETTLHIQEIVEDLERGPGKKKSCKASSKR